MRKPIIINIGRDPSCPDFLITATPVGEPDKVWGQYRVTFEFPIKDGKRAQSEIHVTNFPRALGTDGLAYLLVSVWLDTSKATGGRDDEQGGDFPPMPTDEEMRLRPITIAAVSAQTEVQP